MKDFFCFLLILSSFFAISCSKNKNDEQQNLDISQSENFSEIQNIESNENENFEKSDNLESEENGFTEEKVFTEESQKNEFFLVDKDGKLSFYSIDDEIFLPQNEDNFTVLTSVNKKIITRSFYDEFGRFCKQEDWKNSTNDDVILLKEIFYEYEENNLSPIKKIIIEDNSRTEIEYDEKENQKEIKKFYILKNQESENENEDKVETKNILLSQTNYFYNSENKLESEITKDFSYSEDYNILKSTLEKKFLYFYKNQEEIPADYDYFENGILRIRNLYTNIKGNYTAQVFFDENYSVKTYYENNLKTKDVYILNGLVVRENIYE